MPNRYSTQSETILPERFGALVPGLIPGVGGRGTSRPKEGKMGC